MSTASHAIKDIINERSRVRHKKRGGMKNLSADTFHAWPLRQRGSKIWTQLSERKSDGNRHIETFCHYCCLKKRNLCFLSSFWFWFVISRLIWQVMDRSLKSQIMIYHTSKVIIIIHLLIWSHHQELFVQELIHHQRLTLTQVISGHYFGWGSSADGDFPYQSISN